MSETTEELYARALAAADDEARLPLPAIADWETFPFEGGLRVRPLLAPVEVDRPRLGETATDCWRCQRGEDGVIWGDDRWLLSPLQQPSGLPCVVLLQPRDHHDLGDLPDALTGCNARLERTASNDNGSRLSRPRSGDRRRWKERRARTTAVASPVPGHSEGRPAMTSKKSSWGLVSRPGGSTPRRGWHGVAPRQSIWHRVTPCRSSVRA